MGCSGENIRTSVLRSERPGALMLERLSNENYARIVDEHLGRIAPDLQRIDGAIATASAGDRAGLEVLRTMRIYLLSGLFDVDFYLRENPDLRQPDIDLLEHFVRFGEKEGRRPNPVFWPWFFRDDTALPPPCEFEASGRADQLALMRVKRMLMERLGLSEAFDCYRRMLDLDEGEQISLKRISGLREAAAVQSSAFYEVAAAGESFRVAAPNVPGEGNHQAVDGVARSIFVACLIDARVRGRSGVIETGELALLDYQEFETAQPRDQLDFDPAVFQAADNAAWIIVAGDDDRVLELDEGFLLIGPHTDGFGHWLWEYLPKYIAAVHAHALPPVPVLIDADMPKLHRQALELMLPEGVAIVELPAFAPARVRRLWCAPSQMYIPVLPDQSRCWDCLVAPPGRYAPIIDQIVRRIDRGSPGPDGTGKLFLARRDFRHRRLYNEQAIEAVAAERGFRIVDPEELDFAEQIRLVRDARFIIGADAPALFLAFFARPGTRLCILSHPDPAGLTVLTGALGEIGIDVTVLTGPSIPIGDENRDGSLYQIDEDRIAAVIDSSRVNAGGAGAAPALSRSEVEAEIASLRAELAARDAKVVEATDRTKEMVARLRTARAERAERDAALARADRQAAERDAAAQAAESELSRLRRDLAESEGALAEATRRAAEMAARLHEALAAAEQTVSELSARDATLVEVTNRADLLAARLAALEAERDAADEAPGAGSG